MNSKQTLKLLIFSIAQSYSQTQTPIIYIYIYIYYYLRGFFCLDSSISWFENTPTHLDLNRDKTKGHLGKNISLTLYKIGLLFYWFSNSSNLQNSPHVFTVLFFFFFFFLFSFITIYLFLLSPFFQFFFLISLH